MKYKENSVGKRKKSNGSLLLKRTWEKRILVLLITFLCTAASLAVSLFVITPQFDATSKVYVASQKDGEASNESKDAKNGALLEKDYKEIVLADEFINELTENNTLGYSAKQLKKKISVEVPKNTRIIAITVKDKDPQVASELSEAVKTAAIERIKDMTKNEGVKSLEEASVSKVPSFPNIPLNALLATVIGFILAIIGAVVYELSDDRIKSAEDVEYGMDVTLLSVIPEMNLGKK